MTALFVAFICFRIVQEAVTNVVRHAEARHVAVSGRPADSGIAIAVRDDGRGMDVGSARRGALHGTSMGILGMEERVSLLGGHFEILSEVGKGTEVRAFIPERPAVATARAS